ncbi:peptidylprolyl isomerase [Candidatus Woesearchaeota archaeon]|nr:peptidylprolyl isomerase [Candidatus Woesearchaeota archaeon]
MAEKKSVKKAAEKKEAAKEPSNTDSKVVQKGDKVKVDYVGSFNDGVVFDESKTRGKPIEFVAGNGQVIPGFDQGVIGMKVGGEKKITIEPKEGYGEPNPELVKVITRDKLPPEPDPKVGMVLAMGMSNGMEIPARITKVNGEMVTIDLNHPLAGKTLHFKLKVVGVE